MFFQVQIYTHNNYNNGVASLIEATKSGADREWPLILRTLLKQLKMDSIIACRGILRRMLNIIWIINMSDLADKPPFVCKINKKHHMKDDMWDIEDYYSVSNGYNRLNCNGCKCNQEVRFSS